MQINKFKLVLQWSKMITEHVCHLAFKREDAEAFIFIPGQFITFHIQHDDKILRRSYSVATIQGKSDCIEIAAGYVENGVATNLLFNLQPGQVLTAAGPFGRLILRDEQPQRYVLVATGTGVTPYRAMLPQLAQRLQEQPDLQVTLLLGVRTQRDLLYGDEFSDFAKQHENFHFHAFYSREQPPNTQPFEHQHHGYVYTGFDALSLNPEQDIVYLCGNPDMIDDAFAWLKEHGFDAHNVRREKYISSGH